MDKVVSTDGLKEVFTISEYKKGKILDGEFNSYGEAVEAIKKLPKGQYQVNKTFVK